MQGNVKRPDGAASTAVVVQHAEDGVEDGHETIFQSEAPKHQYRCFLQSLVKGAPRVPKAPRPTLRASERHAARRPATYVRRTFVVSLAKSR